MQIGALKSSTPVLRRLAARVLPSSVVEHLRELRDLSGAERRAHVTTTLRRLAGRPAPVPEALEPGGCVVFVCHGNIIRSALAEALVRRYATERGVACDRVRSAGLSARPGREADPRAVAAGAALGVELGAHRAQPLTAELVNEAQAIYVMDRLNEAKLLARFPQAAGKVRRLGALALDDVHADVIGDPYAYGADAVTSAAARIDVAARALVAELERRSARMNAHRSPRAGERGSVGTRP